MNKQELLSMLNSDKHKKTIKALENFADDSTIEVLQDAFDYAKRANIRHFQITGANRNSVLIDTFTIDADVRNGGGYIIDREEILYNNESYHLINGLESHPVLISKDALNNHELYIVFIGRYCTNQVYQNRFDAIKGVVANYNYSARGSVSFGDYEVYYNKNSDTFDVHYNDEINKFETAEQVAKFLNKV